MTKNVDARHCLLNIKRQAVLLLGQRGNLLRMSGAFLFLIAILATTIHIFEAICYFIFFEEIPFYMLLAEITIILALALPLCMGISLMAYRMCVLEKTEISDIFHYFAKNKIVDSYRISFAVLGGVFAQLAICFALGWVISYSLSGFGNKMIPEETYILTLVLFLPVSGTLPSIYVLPNAFFKSGDANYALHYSKSCDRLSPKHIIGFNFSFIPLALISVLSLGILFVVYTIPFYMVSLQLLIIRKSNVKENS